jgi:alkylation response protein AidB-like acyl-CoA dehydrogenase
MGEKMDWQLSDEQNLIRQSITDFVAATDFKQDKYNLLQELAELDYLGIFLPEDCGGGGFDFLSYVLTVEAIAKTNAATAFLYAQHCSLAAYSLANWGSKTAQEELLTALLSGVKIGAFAYGEGSPEADYSRIATTAVVAGDSYILNGKKTFVINAREASSVYIVFAQTGEGELSAFAVDGSRPGVKVGEPLEGMGLEGVAVADVTFEQVQVPVSFRLGELGQGGKIAKGALRLHNIAIAAIATGISETALQKSLQYGAERVQFGVPILKFEAIQNMVGLMAVQTEAAKLLTYQAGSLRDRGLPFEETGLKARYFAQTSGEQTCLDAIQVHGGYGYVKEMEVEVLFRDIKGLALSDTPVPLLLEISRF